MKPGCFSNHKSNPVIKTYVACTDEIRQPTCCSGSDQVSDFLLPEQNTEFKVAETQSLVQNESELLGSLGTVLFLKKISCFFTRES